METKKTKKFLSLIMCGVLAATTAITAVFVGAGCKKNEDKAEVPLIPIEDKILDENGNDLSGGDFCAMPQNMVFAPKAAMFAASNSKMEANVTATITPSNAANKLVDWTVAFKTPSATWASGKTVTDYVTVTPTSDGSLSAKITCKQGFAEKILVTVTSRDNTSVKATCTLDYKQQFLGYGITLTGFNTVSADYTTSSIATAYKVNFDSSKSTSIAISYKKSSVYTVARTDAECGTVSTVTFSQSTALANALKAVKDGMQADVVAPVSIGVNMFDSVWMTGFSLTTAQRNSAIAAFTNNKANAITVTLKDSSNATLDSWTMSLDTSSIGSVKVEGITLDTSTITFE